MSEPRPVVHDQDGRPGTLASLTPDADDRLAVLLADGARVQLPAALIARQPDGTYRADVSFAEIAPSSGDPVSEGTVVLKEVVLKEIEERLDVSTRVRETGRVHVSTHMETETQQVSEDVWREAVEVERIARNTPVDAPREPWTEGNVTVVPVYEEVLVVRKQLVLREEIHLRRRRETDRHEQSVELRRQSAQVERIDPEA